MPDRFLVSAVGAVIDVDVSRRDRSFQDRAYAAWADALYEGPVESAASVVVREELDDAAALAMLSTDVTLAALSERRRDGLWMLHAAGLANRQGRVVVLCAPSGTGKTTAARHLAARYSYVSDETVGIDGEGGVVGYRKPLSIIEPDRIAKNQVAPSAFESGQPLPTGLRLSKILVLDRQPDGPRTPEREELDLATALELLTPQSSYLCDLRNPLRTIEAILNATGGAERLRYRDAENLDDVIEELMHHAPSREPLRLRPRTIDRVQSLARTDGAAYFRNAMCDAVSVDDHRLAVLQRGSDGGRLRILDGIAPSLWAEAAGAPFAALRAAAVAAHGSPDGVDVDQSVRQALDELLAEELLSRRPSWSISDDAAWAVSGERTTVMNLAMPDESPLVLEGSAHDVWSILIDELSMSQDRLIAVCAERFEVDESSIAGQVEELLWRLAQHGIVAQA